MRTSVLSFLLPVLSATLAGAMTAGCTGTDADGDGIDEAPPSVDLIGHTIQTPNVAGAVCGWLYDNNEDQVVDASLGRITIVGTDHDDPCSIVASGGNWPETGELEFLMIEAWFPDLDWTNVVENQQDGEKLWEMGVGYTADGSDQSKVEITAHRLSDNIEILSSGGPPLGTITLIEQTLDGLHFSVDGQVGYVNLQDGTNEQASPPDPFSVEWEDVQMCPSACDN